MRLSKDFLVHDADENELVLIPTDRVPFHGVIHGNITFKRIVKLLEKDTDKEKMADELMNSYSGAEREEVERDIDEVLSKLREVGALEE